ncbi:MAG: hypothetical protein COZ15_05360 [Elusimicrobia bacterium CG_4_10_14_3_um_filter_49_12_50_7]|nr:MAG: hypothetical protein COZ72_04605 [Elusimicrobia bacterium CG_4_8_14_3_um_filter_50_9]PIY16567.1 MAG: hypothetical protein COZ15_05360 [Elusimicrobia bacterium CG_4_10_14_3_um_filter_49_12_50_7]
MGTEVIKMPRKPRFTIDDGCYHVLSRGHNKRKIFHEDSDFFKYLKILKAAKIAYSFKIYHFSLIPNHVHLILNTKKGEDLTMAMRFINQHYAQYYRSKYGGSGYVWQDRFKSFLIQSGIYMLRCGIYIELNSVMAGLVNNPEDYRWSSSGIYISGKKSDLVDFDPEYEAISGNKDERRRVYLKYLRDGLKEKRSLKRYFREGAYGDAAFIKKLKKSGLRQSTWRKGRPKND